ncbi:MAG: hypothetical protein JWN07_3478 [Hyphomicrobiales bacterium]|nr:hypothetical protein [Hyphomicrobiales bacterium]
MSAPKRPPLPAILLANDLLDGEVVFWTGSAWSPLPGDALVARDDEAAAQLEQAAQAGLAAQKVVDAYLVDVAVDAAGVATPRHYREKIKTEGPTTRRDLGKQAGLYNIAPAGN